MNELRFCFVLHIHQPVGNFDHVFREHADDVYRPFFDFLGERGLWPIGLHISGPLIEWLGDHDAALHDRIGGLAADGRIELLSSGWDEPILACLPRADRADQLGLMREQLEKRFGVTPTGAWLTERVWEPDLPADLAPAGIEYVLVDDHLATKAGVERTEGALPPVVRTEADGHVVDLLLIDERLRYLIPFRPAEETESDLRARAARGDALALIGDDGEKFGGWPRTKEWLYEGGWLEDFGARMDALREEGVVRLVTPARARAEVEVTGPVYVPSGSYPEMEGWALGGHWKGFLTRYDEANRMHKRMLALSALCRERGNPARARRQIGRGQCNDPYWHGVFGGLYMKHLREGVRRSLMAAEHELRRDRPLDWSVGDVEVSGRRTWWAHGSAVSAWVDGRYGGTVSELFWLERGVDVCDVLTRRREAYHLEAFERWRERSTSASHGSNDATASIHEIEEAAVLEALPPVDRDVRTLVRDRVLSTQTTFVAYRDGDFTPVWEAGEAHAEDPERGLDPDGIATLTWTFESDESPVEKKIKLLENGTLIVSWRWEAEGFPAGSVFAPELSLGAPVHLVCEPTAETWRYPIVTVSKCPDGFEEIEQGESVTPRWPVEAGKARLVLRPSRT